MSNFSTFFPVPGGGGGGGILNEQVFSSTSSFDPAAAGLSVGDKIIILCVGGGGSGAPSAVDQYVVGGAGGYVQYKNHVLTSVSVIPITSLGGQGGKGYNAAQYYYNQVVQGPHWGATAMTGSVDQAAGGSAGPGLDGYGPGGAAYATSGTTMIISGATGGVLGTPGSGGYSGWQYTEDGTDGIIKIYY